MFVYFVSFEYSNTATKMIGRMEINCVDKITAIEQIRAIESDISNRLFDGTMNITVLNFQLLRKE